MDRKFANYRLREMREDAGYPSPRSQQQLVSDRTGFRKWRTAIWAPARVDALCKYVEATGGELEVAVKRPKLRLISPRCCSSRL
jgi:hypothetical protein